MQLGQKELGNLSSKALWSEEAQALFPLEVS